MKEDGVNSDEFNGAITISFLVRQKDLFYIRRGKKFFKYCYKKIRHFRIGIRGHYFAKR
jgi:hypothetical protein